MTKKDKNTKNGSIIRNNADPIIQNNTQGTCRNNQGISQMNCQVTDQQISKSMNINTNDQVLNDELTTSIELVNQNQQDFELMRSNRSQELMPTHSKSKVSNSMIQTCCDSKNSKRIERISEFRNSN